MELWPVLEWNNGITKIFELEYWKMLFLRGPEKQSNDMKCFSRDGIYNEVIEQPGAAPLNNPWIVPLPLISYKISERSKADFTVGNTVKTATKNLYFPKLATNLGYLNLGSQIGLNFWRKKYIVAEGLRVFGCIQLIPHIKSAYQFS